MHQRPDSDYVHVDHIPETKNKSLEGSLLYGGNNVSINVTLDQLLIFLDDRIDKRYTGFSKQGCNSNDIVIFVLRKTPFPYHLRINMLILACMFLLLIENINIKRKGTLGGIFQQRIPHTDRGAYQKDTPKASGSIHSMN